MSKEHAPFSRKEEEEKKAAETQQQSGLVYGKGNATYNRMMNKLSPLKGGSMFKKKSNVSQPGDASEVQADTVAKAVTEGNASAAQVELQNDVVSGEGITAKASDVTIETPPGFEEQIEKMKGGGLPLPDDKKSNLEEMLGTDLDHVRLHTGADAAELSDQINALAFATGDDIFYPGDLNDEELLAHEVVHTLQGGGDFNAKIRRQIEPTADNPEFVQYLPMKKGVVIKEEAYLEHTFEESTTPIITYRQGETFLLKWGSPEWYYVIDVTNNLRGYVKTGAVKLIEPEADRSYTEEDITRWQGMSLWAISQERGIAWSDILTNFQIFNSDSNSTKNDAYAYAKKRIMEGWVPADGKPEVRSWYEGDLLVVDSWKRSLARKYVLSLGYKPDTGFIYKWYKSFLTADENANETYNVYELRDKPTLIELEYKQAHEDPDIPFKGTIYEFSRQYGTYAAYAEKLDSKYAAELSKKMALFKGIAEGKSKNGIIKYVPEKTDDPAGVRFRSSPFTETDMKNNGFRNQHNFRRYLPLSTKMTLLRYLGYMNGVKENWYEVKLETGEVGFVAGDYIETNLPEPGAFYHLPVENEGLLRIAARYMKGGDARDFANLIVRINDPYRVFNIVKTPFNKYDKDAWAKVQTLENVLIWIPSTNYALEYIKNDPNSKTSDSRIDELLDEQKEIEAIQNEVNETVTDDFRKLIDEANTKIDKEFVDRFNHIVGLNWKDVLGSLFGLAGISISLLYKIKSFCELSDEMKAKGQDIMVLVKIRKLFRDIMMKKAFSMLETNAKYLQDELTRYGIQENWDKLYGILTGKRSRFNDADWIRVRGIKRYMAANPVSGWSATMLSLPTGSILKILVGELSDNELFESVVSHPANYYKDLFISIEATKNSLSDMQLATFDPPTAKAKREIEKDYPEFDYATAKDNETKAIIAEEGKENEFLILYDQSVDWRSIARMDNATMKARITGPDGILQERVKNIVTTRTKLLNDHELIWELQPVGRLAIADYGILPETNAFRIAWDPIADKEFANNVRDIGLAALGIILGILSFFTAGAAAVVVGVLALAVDATAAYFAYKDYAFHSAASNTNIGELESLSEEDPSLAGVVMAIIGAIVSAIGPAIQAARLVTILRGIRQAKNVADEFGAIWDILNTAGKVSNESRPAFISRMMKTYNGDKALLDVHGKILDDFLVGLGKPKGTLKGLNRYAFSKLHEFDPTTAKILLNSFSDNPFVIGRLSSHLLGDANALTHFKALRSLFAADDAAKLGPNGLKVFEYLGSTGADTIGNLPKLLYIVETENITDVTRLRTIFTDRAEQAALLSKYATVFNNWKKLPTGVEILLDDVGIPIRLRYTSQGQQIERTIDYSTGEFRLKREDGSFVKAGDVDNPGDKVLKDAWEQSPGYHKERVLLPQITGKIIEIPGLSQSEISLFYEEANRMIDEVSSIPNTKNQPGAGVVLIKDSKFISALSNKTGLQKGQLPNTLHSLVENWFKNPNVENADYLILRNTHGKCGEPEAVSKWLFEYEKLHNVKITTIDEAKKVLTGTKSIAFETTTKINYKTKSIIANVGDVKVACESCNPFLSDFGIKEVFVKINIKQ
jgi:hypothetical protein